MLPLEPGLLQLALASVKDYAVIVLDPRGVVTAWLCGCEDILGYSAAEAVGQPISRLFVPEDLEKGLDHLELEIAGRDSRADDERWHVRKDGTRIWASGSVTALKDDAGRVLGFVKVLRDRTDMRTQTESLANQMAGVREAMERTSRFLHTLGHEMRNPLGPIQMSTHILQRLSNDPRVHKVAGTIGTQVAVLERMANDLMDVSRLHHRKLQLHIAEIDLCQLLRDAVSGMMLPATAKGLKLSAILPNHPLWVPADADRLQQVVSNLLTNAIKYTPEGGQIWVKATQEANELVLRVQDTGIGIAPETLPRIFELFTQEQRAESLVPGGLGIGLGIVREIVELHGGFVQARSSGDGKGSEFTVRLPRRRAARAEAPLA